MGDEFYPGFQPRFIGSGGQKQSLDDSEAQQVGLCGQPMLGHGSGESQQVCHLFPIHGKLKDHRRPCIRSSRPHQIKLLTSAPTGENFPSPHDLIYTNTSPEQ